MPRLILLVPTSTYRATAFVEAARKLNIDLTIASEEPSSLSDLRPIDLIDLDFSKPETSADAIKKFAAKHGVAAVVGVDDQATLAASAINSALGLPGNTYAATYATHNKFEARRRLQAANVSGPRYQLIPTVNDPYEAARTVKYPCVLKPLMMSASRGVLRANSPDDFEKAFTRITELIQMADAPADEQSRANILVEEYVPGWEVAVEGILTDGTLQVLTIFDKPDPLPGPYFPEGIYVTPSRHPGAMQKKIAAITQDAVRAIGLRHGPIHAEVRSDGDRIWFLEVAARSIGGYCSKVIRFAGDLSLEDVILRHALNPRYEIPNRETPAAGVMMMQAPRAGIYQKTRGLEYASAVEHVEEIIISAHPKEQITPLPEGFLYLGFIFARADTPETAERALREAYKKLDFEITPV
jgi:biotin carboxylase